MGHCLSFARGGGYAAKLLYLDGNTGHPIHPTVGRHEIHCGYHYPPLQYVLCDYFPRERIEEAMELYTLAGYILEELA